MSELLSDLFALDWPVVAVILAVVIPFTLIVVAGLIALGLYLITRIPPIRWVATVLIEAATEPARRWAEKLIDDRMAPISRLEEIDAPEAFAELRSDQALLKLDVARIESKAENAAELGLRLEAAMHRLRQDFDDFVSQVPDTVSEED